MYKSLYIILFLFAASGVQAQQLPERSLVRKGNRQYNKGNYEQSAGHYEQALQAAPGQFEAIYNLGNALYKAERFDRAEQTMQQAAADSLRADTERAEAFYNLGNAQFKQQKYQEALESYKQSLRLNPSDMEAKYNYAYTKRRWRRRSEQGPEPRPEQGSEPERSESAEPRSERRSEGPKGRPQGPAGRSETEPAGGQGRQGGPGRPAGAADAFGHLAAGTAADARRHPGPGGQDPGETQGETGRGRPRKEKLVVF